MDKAVSFIKPFWYLYTPGYIKTVVYMLQVSSYKVTTYARWVRRTRDFRTVIRRHTLRYTLKAILLLVGAWVFVLTCVAAGLWLVLYGQGGGNMMAVVTGILIVLTYPWTLLWVITVPLVIGREVIQKPREKRLIEVAAQIISDHPAKKIAIAGSYGKTSFKEMLATVLTEGLHVAATPGNMNTPLGISRFVDKLDGTEDVLIFEFGEEQPGDVSKLCELTQPSLGVITGVSEAHLESFGNVEAITDTIFELEDFIPRHVYKNGEDPAIISRVGVHDKYCYDREHLRGWKVEDVQVGLDGTSFTASKERKTLWVESGLLGRHQIGPLIACVDIADRLGMSVGEIIDGLRNTKPFEHRMCPRHLNGAIVIDDTYNGNPRGVKAGLDFLSEVHAKRKIYVTPGLVEQGAHSERIHEEIGKHIAQVADVCVLMRNSVTKAIQRGLSLAEFTGELQLVEDPVEYYTNLQHFVASGDVVMLQNDWSDNYA